MHFVLFVGGSGAVSDQMRASCSVLTLAVRHWHVSTSTAVWSPCLPLPCRKIPCKHRRKEGMWHVPVCLCCMAQPRKIAMLCLPQLHPTLRSHFKYHSIPRYSSGFQDNHLFLPYRATSCCAVHHQGIIKKQIHSALVCIVCCRLATHSYLPASRYRLILHYTIATPWSVLTFSMLFYSPPQLADNICKATGLPGGWEVRHSNSKNLPYYFNVQTKESRWEPPTGTDSETLKHYMGTYHSSANLRSDGAGAPEGKIRCAHLLVKHKDSRRPSSWREAEITRTKDEATSIILGHETRIKSGATSLGDMATTESDCSSARKRGDLYVEKPFPSEAIPTPSD